jgi:hypothetical protein
MKCEGDNYLPPKHTGELRSTTVYIHVPTLRPHSTQRAGAAPWRSLPATPQTGARPEQPAERQQPVRYAAPPADALPAPSAQRRLLGRAAAGPAHHPGHGWPRPARRADARPPLGRVLLPLHPWPKPRCHKQSVRERGGRSNHDHFRGCSAGTRSKSASGPPQCARTHIARGNQSSAIFLCG